MKKIIYGVTLLGFALLNSEIGLSQIEQALSTLVIVSVICLFELTSINDKLDKWK